MERKISAIIISLLLLGSIIVVVNNEQNVKATDGEGGEDVDNIGLDYDFMWDDVVRTVCDAVYKAYQGDEITKGREFGSNGDKWTADKIFHFMDNNCSLENVIELPLAPIVDCPNRYYSSKINITDYLLHIDNSNYNQNTGLPNDVPVNETFVFPQAYPQDKTGSLTFNSIMTDEENVRVIEPWSKNLVAGGGLTNYYLNLSVFAANQYDLIIGNATYVANDDPLPEDQDDRILIFDEEEGECEERLENVTNASGVILIHNVTSRYNTPNASNCSFCVGKVNSSESNLSEILDMLNNSEILLVENFLCNETLTFTYNINCEHLIWPNYNFILIDELEKPAPAHSTGYVDWMGWTILLRWVNLLAQLPCRGECKGVILFNNFTYGSNYNSTHFMNVNNPSSKYNGWFRFYYTDLGVLGFPGLPIYWVNLSVGSWLISHAGQIDNTVTGYVNQEYLEEIHGDNPQVGVEAYNVIGNITTDRSGNIPDPDDPTIIISNRYDGWWSEAAFDSGCGVGVVLTIAKYFNDYNITPKVNITFLEDTGEEYKYRGAQHFSDSHPNNNYSLWIGFDQLAVNWENTTLNLTYNDEETKIICETIANETDYPNHQKEKNYTIDHNVTTESIGAEEDVWKERDKKISKGGIDCPYESKTICFCKDAMKTNPFRHRRGENFTEGDLLKNIDREDLNVTLELAWNITKYFCVNPDSWFTTYTASMFDSPDDGDDLPDSIRANFTMKSILPQDLVMVHAYLRNSTGDANQTVVNYTINSTGKQASITLTLPPDGTPGFYKLYLELYNSTERINEIVFGESNTNDSEPVPPQVGYLYPYVPDTTPPSITDVSANPDVVGFGFNVTISANVTDDGSGISSVKINITQPDNTSGNYTMNNTFGTGSGNTHQYIFDDTWLHGQYNYTIWATDNASNNNTTSVYSFNVSTNATINVYTLKDDYSRDEFVNITDPPNPLDDYYIVERGLTWDKYYNATSGMNTLVVSQTPVNYQNETSVWSPINYTINTLEDDHIAYGYGYRFGNERGLYNVYFKPNIQDPWPVVFAYNKSINPENFVVRSKFVGVGYLDPSSNWSYEILQNIQNSQGQIIDNSVNFEDVFTGTDVVWSYGNTGLKEEIIMSNATKTVLQGHPPSDYGLSNQGSYLVFITKLDYSGLNMYNATGILSGNFTVTDGGIDFKDALGQFKCALPLGEAYELYDDSVCQSLVYRVLQYNGNFYLLSGLKLVDLNNMSFPVVIDPTLTLTALSSDGFIYASSTNYNTAWTASSGTVSSSVSYISIGQKKVAGIPPTYNIYRGFLMFNTSEIPINANISNATLSLYKLNDYSTTDFILTLQDGQPLYPHIPLYFNDYNKNHYSGNGGELNTSNFVNGVNNITLTDFKWIKKGNITKFCLRSSRDINGTTPTGNEYVNVYSADAPDVPIGYLPKLIITYLNQSKIKNTGETNFSGYLLMHVDYLEGEEWILDTEVVDETSTRTVTVGGQLGLDTVFNGLVNTNDLNHGSGTYRVYAAFRDPDGDVLICDDDSLLEATYEFTVNI